MVADHAVGDPGAVARGARRAVQPFAHGALGAARLLDFRHQQADPHGRAPDPGSPRTSGASAARAASRSWASIAARAIVIWLSESKGATRASARARASRSPRESPWRTRNIRGGEIRMRSFAIRGLDDFRGAAIVAGRGGQSTAQSGGGDKARRERQRILSQASAPLASRSARSCASAVFSTARQRLAVALSRSFAAAFDSTVARAPPSRYARRDRREPPERPRAALHVCAPARRIRARPPLAAAARFHVQPAQSERMGLGMFEHLVERRDGAGAIAIELGGLRAQQLGQRFLGQKLPSLGGMPVGGARIARADRDHAARERGDSPSRAGERARRSRSARECGIRSANRPDEPERDGQGEHEAQRKRQRASYSTPRQSGRPAGLSASHSGR